MVVADTTFHARQAADKVKVDYTVLEPVTDPFVALEPGAPQVHPARQPVRARESARLDGLLHGAMWKRRLRLPRTSSNKHLPRSRSNRPFLNRSPAWRCLKKTASKCCRKARALYSTRNRLPQILKLPLEKVEVAAGCERRCFWSKRRAFHPGADGAGGVSAAASGENHSHAQTIDAAPRQTPSDGFEIQSGRRCRGPSACRACSYCGRYRRLCRHRRQMPASRCVPFVRPLPGTQRRCRIQGRIHKQSDQRRHARLRQQPGPICDGGDYGPPRGEGGRRWL